VYIVVVGGGKVGYFLSKELLEAGHELVILEKNAGRARQIADELGSIVLNRDGCEGKHLAEAGANRATIVAAVTGDDEDNLVVCQMAKHHFDVPRTIARVNNPKNEQLFRHLGVDEIISPTRMALASIEQDIPVHELLHLAQLKGGELELLEAQIAEDSPAVGRSAADINLPEGASLFVLLRGNSVIPIRGDTVFTAGDKILAVARPDSEDELRRQLIGDGQ
jgi:trk system potassium uptake protein TrkA